VKAPSSGLGSICATIAIVALPSSAAAETYVPPGNSAATQYTEAVPTAGGPKATGKSPHKQSSSPAKILGGPNSRRLEEQGPQGKAAAEAAAATAPGPVAPGATPQAPETAPSGSGGGKSAHGEGNGETGEPSTGNGAGQPSRIAKGGAPAGTEPGGSSGLGEVVGQATGASSSGTLGPLLPLAIVAAIVWSLAYVSRRRKRPVR
jgi:hypothetical protein